MLINFLTVLFSLIAAHFICDFPLQGDTTAREKNRHSTTELQKLVPWYYWMFAHSIMHGFSVFLVFSYIAKINSISCIWLGLTETFLHFITDWGKCENMYDIHFDQKLHIFVKIGYALILFVPYFW